MKRSFVPVLITVFVLWLVDKYFEAVHPKFLISLIILLIFAGNMSVLYMLIYLEKKIAAYYKAEKKLNAVNEIITVYHRGVYININQQDIAYIYHDNRINWLITKEGEEMILDLSLKEVNSLLNSSCFFKVNRNYTVHKKAIHSWRPGSYGKIELDLKFCQTTVSKDRAGAFRKWF